MCAAAHFLQSKNAAHTDTERINNICVCAVLTSSMCRRSDINHSLQ